MQTILLLECLLLWLALSGGLGLGELLVGFIVSLAGAGLFTIMFRKESSWQPRPVSFCRVAARVGWACITLVIFVYEVFASAVRLARTIVRGGRVVSRVTSYPVSLQSPLAVTVFSSLITLTPGTLAIDYIPQRRALYIHCLSEKADAAPLASIQKLENLIKKVAEC